MNPYEKLPKLGRSLKTLVAALALSGLFACAYGCSSTGAGTGATGGNSAGVGGSAGSGGAGATSVSGGGAGSSVGGGGGSGALGGAGSASGGTAGAIPSSGGRTTGGSSSGSGGAGGATGLAGATGGAAGAGATGGAGGAGGSSDTTSSWTITSPGNVIRATVQLLDKGNAAGYTAGVKLYFRVEAGGPAAYATVLDDSPLGITRADASFVTGLTFDSAGPVTAVDDTYTMLTGKKSTIHATANERVLTFRANEQNSVQLVLRAYDGGFAFRYKFPETDATAKTVTGESTGFKIPSGSRAWILPYDVAGTYTPAYENTWRNDLAVGTAAPSGTAGWCLPALFQTPDRFWVMIGDTDVTGSYFAAHLAGAAPNNLYSIAMPAADEANATGAVNPQSMLPWTTPWRMVVAGPTPGAILESTLATDLASPSVVADTSWIKPGRVSWSWWSADTSPSNYSQLVPFVDMAQTMTWEYSLIDAGWDTMTGGTYQSLLAYANPKNVGLILWYSSGGPNNSITQYGPRDRLYDASKRKTEFQTISQAGAKGVKIDFFLSDKPTMMQYYLDILKDAAANHLMVNFHGSTIPRGWQRTYPNLVTAEAVRGAENYKYDTAFPAGVPQRNTILPFTRNMMASMDFTPVTFSDSAYPHVTTSAHELALSVVFESGWQHFADKVSAYTSLPAGPKAFLQQVPTTWDDTRYVQGTPGQLVVLARRKGTVWYVAGIAGDSQARNLTVPLTFLDSGSYTATQITDGSTDRTFSDATTRTVTAADSLTPSLRGNGGFVARLVPAAN